MSFAKELLWEQWFCFLLSITENFLRFPLIHQNFSSNVPHSDNTSQNQNFSSPSPNNSLSNQCPHDTRCKVVTVLASCSRSFPGIYPAGINFFFSPHLKASLLSWGCLPMTHDKKTMNFFPFQLDKMKVFWEFEVYSGDVLRAGTPPKDRLCIVSGEQPPEGPPSLKRRFPQNCVWW